MTPAHDAAAWTLVATMGDFGPARRLVRQVRGRDILLLRVADEVLAVDNRCTHLDQPLDKGRVMSGQITCPFHGACFDLRSGAALSGPAVTPLRCHRVRRQGDQVLIALAD